MKNNEFQYNSINKSIHEPARLIILLNLSVMESTDFIFLMKLTGLTDGNLSAHLKKLKSVEYIDIKKEFKDNRPYTTITMTQKGKTAFSNYVDIMKGLFDSISK
jgi:DNA-binding MarR family transcriptional regulator